MAPTDVLRLEVRAVDPNSVDAVIDALNRLGGDVETSYGRTVHASLSADAVRGLAEADAVRIISKEIEPQEFKRTTSEGIEITNIDSVRKNEVDGSGTKVAVIDFYFDTTNPKYADNVVDTIGDSGSFYTDKDELHGTGCAEVVYDMAPEADLVLASITNSSIGGVLDKIESNHPDTDVTTMSIGYAPTDRLDGQDDKSSRIASHTDGGRLFTVSAGNEAYATTWHGPYRDSDGNGIMEFDDSGGEYIKVNSPTASSYIFANWDDWDDLSNLDYTLTVYEDSSKTTQIGSDAPTTEPWAYVQFSGTPPSEAYIEITKGSDADGTQEFDVWTWGGDANMELANYTASRSIAIPATSRDAETLSTAAVQATSTGAEPNAGDLKYYSSRGPTRDDRHGIDVAAPSRVSQTDNGYGSLDDWDPANGVITGFNGTSAAAPHVGGIAAALFELDGVSNVDVRDAILSTGTAIPDSGVSDPPNTKIGNGYVAAKAAYEYLTTSLSTPLATKWTSNDLGGRAQFNTPAVDTQHVYAGGLQNAFYALSRNDGESVSWSLDRGPKTGLSDSSGYRYSDQIFFGSGDGKLYGVDADDATRHWSSSDTPDLDSAITSSPTVANDMVFAGTNDGRVLAWDYATAALQWETSVGSAVYSDLRAAAGLVYVTTEDGELVVLDASNGAEQWRASFTRFGNSSPGLGDGRVYVAADEVYAYDASATKNQVWASSGYGGTAGSSPVYRNGTVYVGSDDGDLYALDASSGAVEWTYTTGGTVAATPGLDGDGTRVAVVSTDGTLAILDWEGTELQTLSFPADSRSTPVLDGGQVFVGSSEGTVYAYE